MNAHYLQCVSVLVVAALCGCADSRSRSTERAITEFESVLTKGTWFTVTGSGPFTEYFAFTFRSDHTVGSRIYSDYTNSPVVRDWSIGHSDVPGWFRLTYTIKADSTSDNNSAFYMLQSGSLLHYDRGAQRIYVSGDETVTDARMFLHPAEGTVFDDGWYPEVAD